MTLEEYNRIIDLYNEAISASMGIPEQTKRTIDAKMEFISKSIINPTYTIKASWFIREGQMVAMDDSRLIQMHPFDFCVAYNSITKDWNKALDLLKKYIHEKIDQRTNGN